MLLSANDIVKQTWHTYKTHWRTLVPYILANFLPYLVLSLFALIAIIITALILRYTSGGGSAALGLVIILVVLAALVAALVFSFWAGLALMKAVRDLYVTGATNKFSENLKLTSQFIGNGIAVTVLKAILIFLGGIAFIIPGVIFTVWLAFSSQVVVFENQGPVDALKKSKDLTTGRWFEVVWRLVVPYIIFCAILVIVLLLVSFVFPGNQNLVQSYKVNGTVNMFDMITYIIEQILTNLVLAVGSPLLVIVGVIVYLNLKENPANLPPSNGLQKL